MSNHDESKRARKVFDAIKGESTRDVWEFREFHESEFRALLANDPTLMKRAAQLNILGIGDSLLIDKMTEQALGDVRAGVNSKTERDQWLNQVANKVISLYELQRKAAWERDASFRISFASDLTDEQFKGALRAVADYYRACGGAGLKVELEPTEVPSSRFGVV